MHFWTDFITFKAFFPYFCEFWSFFECFWHELVEKGHFCTFSKKKEAQLYGFLNSLRNFYCTRGIIKKKGSLHSLTTKVDISSGLCHVFGLVDFDLLEASGYDFGFLSMFWINRWFLSLRAPVYGWEKWLKDLVRGWFTSECFESNSAGIMDKFFSGNSIIYGLWKNAIIWLKILLLKPVSLFFDKFWNKNWKLANNEKYDVASLWIWFR